jgi:dTMP kinase
MEGRPEGGVFITLEGADGAGKSVQAARLATAIRERGHDVVLTREPGGTPLGEQVRHIVLGGADDAPERDALLFNAARAVLVRDVIRPALARGAVVVCDRFADSTIAYQGAGAGLDQDDLRTLERLATGGLRPDVTVLLDLPPTVALGRRHAGPATDRTRFEDGAAHDRAFHERVRSGYLALAAQEPGRWRIVDARNSVDAVAQAILDAVEPVLADLAPQRAPRPVSASEPMSRAGRTTG